MRSAFAAFFLVGGIAGGLVAFSATPAVEFSSVIERSTAKPAAPIEFPPGPTALTPGPPATSPVVTVPHPVAARTVPRPSRTKLFEDLVGDLGNQLADPRLEGLDVGVSVWVEDHGVMFTHDPHLALFPASNQKLMTGVGVLGLLPANFHFVTEIAISGDDLIVVAGGDPTLTAADLDQLAEAVTRAGVTEVRGRLVVDATRYSSARIAPGWQDWQMPRYVGPLSTLVVDDNRHRTDDGYLAQPDLGNAELLRAALGSCLAMGYQLRAARRDVELTAIRVMVETDSEIAGMLLCDGTAPPGFTEIRYHVEVESSASSAKVEKIIEEGDQLSPMLDALGRANPMRRSISVRRGGA